MFKKSKRKIVAAIMSVLVLLWAGTLGLIYATSYFEVKTQNQQMLRSHWEMHTPPQPFDTIQLPARPRPEGNHGFGPESPMFRLATFYTVALADDGEILEIKNQSQTVYTDEQLEMLAKEIIKSGKTTGTKKNLAFYAKDKGMYTLVVFMDNTVVNQRAMTLFRYTLIFGGVALILFFFLSRYLAKIIVTPLEESYQKQKQFISDAGHELKTPIAVVSANAELLSRELGDNQWLTNIQYENERMGMLVGQLLDLARTENAAPHMEHLDFSRLVAGESLPFESVAFERNLTLTCNIASGISLEGNSTQLKQLVSILLDNAIRHSSGSQVQLCLTKEHGLAKLSVINDGDEIPPEQQVQIFERFYRLDSARNSEENHYGLGLAIAKAITTAHKGDISLLCHSGLVEFKVQLPAQ